VLLLVALLGRSLLGPYRHMQRVAGEAVGGLPGIDPGAGGLDEAERLAEAFRGVIGKLREQEMALQAFKGRAGAAAAGGITSGDGLIGGMSSAAIVIDRRGNLTALNASAERLLGLSRARSIGLPYADLLRGNGRLIDLIGGALETGEGRSREVVPLTGPAGRTSHLGMMISPIRQACGAAGEAAGIEGVLCLLTDLTEIKQLRERVGMKESLAALGELSAGIAHEFRNSLAAIQGYARLLSRQRPPGGAAGGGQHAEAILREVGSLRAVIDDFLRYARPRPLDLAEIDPGALVRDVVDDFRAMPLARGLEVDVEGAFPSIVADETLLRQALLNLLRNAAEATHAVGWAVAAAGGAGPGAEPRGRVTVRGAAAGSAGGIRLTVEDRGAGIEADDRSRIFTPFFSTREKGTGLGLALVQKTVILHDGSIEVDSEPGRGTCITLVLPALPGSAPAGALS
jgi:PAS domain S-box-containing protein